MGTLKETGIGVVMLMFCLTLVSENPTCLVCIARRVPMTEKVNVMLGIDQFTTKQDLQGVILASDVRSVSAMFASAAFLSVCPLAAVSKCLSVPVILA